MANEEHMKVLKQGVEMWNLWRAQNPEIQPDLKGANFMLWKPLTGVNLSNTNLSHITSLKITLAQANLRQANLSTEHRVESSRALEIII